MTTYQIYPPECCANNTHLYLCEVRENNMLIDRKRFINKRDAEIWGKTHPGKQMSENVLPVYLQMIKRYAQ